MRFMGRTLTEINALLAANAAAALGGRRPSPPPVARRPDLFSRPVRAALAPDERTTLQAVRDRLTTAIDGLTTVLGDGGVQDGWAVAALYQRRNFGGRSGYGGVRNDLTGDERTAIEAVRGTITSARADVLSLLSE